MRIERKVNLSDLTQRAILLEEVTSARGWHNVSFAPARAKATHPQHGYYRAVVLPLAKAWLNETQGGDDQGHDFSEDEAHEWLKLHLRPIPVVDKRTGEQVSTIAASHSTYTVKDMLEFIDEVIDLLRKFDVNVPPPSREYAKAG